MLESVDWMVYYFYKDVVVVGCVIGFSDFIKVF